MYGRIATLRYEHQIMSGEYSDDRLAEIIGMVETWGQEFARTTYADALTRDQQEKAERIIPSFAELLYKYDAIEPAEWDQRAVETCLTDLYPRKVSAGENHFRAIAPVLESFFTYLDDHEHLDNGSELAAAVRECEDEILDHARNPDNWGMAKSVFMDAAEEAGIDIDDIDSIDEAEELLREAGVKLIGPPEEVEPRMLSVESEQRFLDLFAHLLADVNRRFDVLDGVETREDIEQRDTQQLVPLRNTLYEEDTAEIIESFVTDNPADLEEADLERVEQWTDYVFGEFMLVDYLDDAAVFLDWSEPPRAYRTKAVRVPFGDIWHEDELPLMGKKVALLPYEDEIVWDGWLFTDPISSMAVEMTLDFDIDDRYEEAKHRFGLIESLPAPDEQDRSDAERLEFYMKNKRNRERFADEIAQLREKNADLERIYHQEIGKARARGLGRTLRDLDLNEAYVAIYDEQVVATGRTETEVRDILEDIMPAGKEDQPYIYHYNP